MGMAPVLTDSVDHRAMRVELLRPPNLQHV
jgi:hypothetical protein